MALDPSQGVALYTDGSCWTYDRCGGWAYIAVDAFGNEMSESGGEEDTTNNQMEMQAIIEGLADLWLDHGPIDVLIRSDSEYVIKGATNPRRARKANRDYWELIDSSIRLHNSVEFEWLRGHDGDHYNTIADDLAGQARKGFLTAC